MSRPPHPPSFTGERNDPRGNLQKNFTEQMERNMNLMGLYAESGWYYDVLPTGSQHFDWHAFPVNIKSEQSQWRVSLDDVVLLKRTPDFVRAHLYTMVYWLSACGFDAINCRFFAKDRLRGRNLEGIARVAKFIHSLNLFADTFDLERKVVPKVTEAYIQLARSVSYFLAELGYYGSYGRQDKAIRYITPGEFIANAQLGKGADIHETNARKGLDTPIVVNNKGAIRDALLVFIEPRDIKLYEGPSFEPIGSTEESMWGIVGATLVVTIGALLLMWRVMRRRRY